MLGHIWSRTVATTDFTPLLTFGETVASTLSRAGLTISGVFDLNDFLARAASAVAAAGATDELHDLDHRDRRLQRLRRAQRERPAFGDEWIVRIESRD